MNIKEVLHGLKINNIIDKQSLFDDLNKEIKADKKNHISITNTEAMYFGINDLRHSNYINSSFLSLCDGTGIVIAGKFNCKKIKRYHGPDFFEDILKVSVKYGWSHYFLGGEEGIAYKLKKKYEDKFKGLNVVGVYSPPFRSLTKKEEKDMIETINNLKPNFVWVSLGLPKQEQWIINYKDLINSNFFVGVGAAFDFHTEKIKRAPVFFRKLGFEWLYRTFFERRLIIRQIRGFNFMFKSIFRF